MEVGKGGGGGPTTSNNRPIRASARFFSYGPNSSSSVNFSGPVRKWHKMWVPVSVPDPGTKKNTRGSKPQLNNKSSNSSILLCKWTPLAAAVDGSGDGGGDGGGFVSRRRKFRYTPIAAMKEQKKVTTKRIADQESAEKTHLSQERPGMDSDDSYMGCWTSTMT